MDLLFQNIIYAFIQGITEFLPVSSSGHLAIAQNLFGKLDVGFDVILHIATLFSLLIYFYKDIIGIIKDFFSFDKKNENFRLALFIIVASIPIVIIGVFIIPSIYKIFSNVYLIILGFIITGLFLFNASIKKEEDKKLDIKNTFIVGLSQALAILPGISRSGSTVSTGILLGIKKDKAVRFSFLLSIPAVIGATILNISDLSFSWSSLLPFLICFIVGLFSINLFIKKIKAKNLRFFAYYCWILAIIILIFKVI